MWSHSHAAEPSSEVLQCFHTVSGPEAEVLMRCCTDLISAPLSPDTLHANLRLCLRLTRRPELAAIFVTCGGPQALLAMTQKSAFRGFTSLAALLFRHCLEEGPLLRQTVEGVVRSVVNNPSVGKNEFRPHGMSSKDVHYILRKLGPCACRNPELFAEVACCVLRVTSDLPTPESFLASRLPVSAVKCLPPDRSLHHPPPLNPNQDALINLLIDHLCADAFESSAAKVDSPVDAAAVKRGEEEAAALSSVSLGPMRVSSGGRMRMSTGGRWRRHGMYPPRQGLLDLDDDVASEDMNVEAESAPPSRQTSSSSSPTANEAVARDDEGREKMTEKPLLSKAAVLRLLAELVQSYPPCAKLIAMSTRKIRIEGEPAKVCSTTQQCTASTV